MRVMVRREFVERRRAAISEMPWTRVGHSCWADTPVAVVAMGLGEEAGRGAGRLALVGREDAELTQLLLTYLVVIILER